MIISRYTGGKRTINFDGKWKRFTSKFSADYFIK